MKTKSKSKSKSKAKQPQEEINEESETENEFGEEPQDTSSTVTYRGPKKFVEGDRMEDDDKKGQASPSKSSQPAVPNQRSNVVDRTIWTIIMLLAFIAIIMSGHVYCSLLIFVLDVGMFKEILALKRNREKDDKLPYSSFVNWYFFGVAVIFFYGKLFSNKLTNFTLSNHIVSHLVLYHNFICFLLWIMGFLMFTLSLKKGLLRYQFRQFAWTHISVCLVVGQSSAIINNLYEGLIWFVLPCLLVIINDTCAYIFGKLIGKTKLIELSPKKTVEGFLGGMACSVLFAVFASGILCQSQYLVCPQNELNLRPFAYPSCAASSVFSSFQIHTPELPIIGSFTLTATEFQFHAFIIALFASLVSPFGGFFASGFKRAIKVKDFAEIIPGHGGITDRMDCQMLTGMFVYLYVHQIVYGRMNSINGVIAFIMHQMDTKDQEVLYYELKGILGPKGLLNATKGA